MYYIFLGNQAIMIHKFQNIHGLVYVVDGAQKILADEIEKLATEIKNEKKFPFSSVYVKIPLFVTNKFMDEIERQGLKVKSSFHKKNEIMMEF